LDSLATINIEPKKAAFGKPVHYISRLAGHGFDFFATQFLRNLHGLICCQNDDRLLLIRPYFKTRNLLKRLATHDDSIDSCHEGIVSIVAHLLRAIKALHPINVAIYPSKEPI